MRFLIQINCDNDAFVNNPEGAVAKLLTSVAARVERGETSGKLLDLNGNSVGTFSFTEK